MELMKDIPDGNVNRVLHGLVAADRGLLQAAVYKSPSMKSSIMDRGFFQELILRGDFVKIPEYEQYTLDIMRG